jgi:hypothetical protein
MMNYLALAFCGVAVAALAMVLVLREGIIRWSQKATIGTLRATVTNDEIKLRAAEARLAARDTPAAS